MGSTTERPEVAVITMARDEGDLLPLWVSHYARHVGIDNLVVIDDNSVDGSTEGLGCTVHRVPELKGGLDFEPVRMRLMNGIAGGLLAVYDYVVFVDVDEFLVTDPDVYPTLPDLLVLLAARVRGILRLRIAVLLIVAILPALLLFHGITVFF